MLLKIQVKHPTQWLTLCNVSHYVCTEIEKYTSSRYKEIFGAYESSFLFLEPGVDRGISGVYLQCDVGERNLLIISYTQDTTNNDKVRKGYIAFDSIAYLVNEQGKTVEKLQPYKSRTCCTPECNALAVQPSGLCVEHYNEWQKDIKQSTCSIPLCGAKAVHSGLCAEHYADWKKSITISTLDKNVEA
jgi:hypothetical protein